MIALGNALLTSYIKARAENVIADCSVGYWLRGERFAAVLIGSVTGHVVAVLWQLAALNLFTVWRRLAHTYQAARCLEQGLPPPPAGPASGPWGRFQVWRYPRGSVPYDVVTGVNIAYVVAAPWFFSALTGHGASGDPLRAWLAG
jgi:hypothetical protein